MDALTELSLAPLVEPLAVKRVLSGLPPAQRDVIIKIYYHKRTAEQDAATLGVSVDEIKKLAYEGLVALRQRLDLRLD